MSAAIELQNVSKRYAKKLAVKNLTLLVQPGEMFGFLGPNGAGKTTTIRLVLGLLRPDEGQVRLFGYDLADEKAGVGVKSRLGFLPDIGQMDGGFTGAEWLQYLAALQTRSNPEFQKTLLARLQLKEEDLRRKIKTYSRGMKQKLAIVQALQHCPALIILDEPTEGLDPLAKHTLFELLNEARLEGATIFFSSHVLSEVERLCDRVALIRAGELVALDSVAALRNQLARRVELTFKPDAKLNQPQLPHQVVEAAGLAGDDEIAIEETSQGLRWRFELRREPNHLLELLAVYPLADLVIEPANLEDVFLRFYQQTTPTT